MQAVSNTKESQGIGLASKTSNTLNTSKNRRTFLDVLGLFFMLFYISQGLAESLENTSKDTNAEQKKNRLKATKKRKEAGTLTPVRPRQNEPTMNNQIERELEGRNFLSRTWRGFRSKLAEKGIQIEPNLRMDFFRNFKGGELQRNVFVGLFDIKTTIASEVLLKNWHNGTIYFDPIIPFGGRPSTIVGDVQWADNIESQSHGPRMYEAYVLQSFTEARTSLLVGLHDVNADFYVTESSAILNNSSFGIGIDFSQAAFNGPSTYPYTALSARVKTQPSRHFYIQTGIFDVISPSDVGPKRTGDLRFKGDKGLMYITELAYIQGKKDNGEDDESERAMKLGFGTWVFTGPYTQLSASEDAGDAISHGVYSLVDVELVKGFSLFNRYGIASQKVNRFRSNWAAGGLIKPHLINEDDALSFGLTQALNGSAYLDQETANGADPSSNELAYEVTYRIPVGMGLTLQPDIQYIRHPNTRKDIRNAWFGGLRVEVAF